MKENVPKTVTPSVTPFDGTVLRLPSLTPNIYIALVLTNLKLNTKSAILGEVVWVTNWKYHNPVSFEQL